MYNFFSLPPIPKQLLSQGSSDEDINILVGENGSGKSTMLSRLADHFLNGQRRQVIAISNTIHDKFSRKDSRMFSLRSASGRTIVRRTLMSALQLVSRQRSSRLENLGRVLDYVNYQPSIGIALKGVTYDFRQRIENAPFSQSEKDELGFVVGQFQQQLYRPQEPVRVDLYQNGFETLKRSELIAILNHDIALRKHRIVREINLFLYRKDLRDPIPLHMASSGELTLISSLIYIATIIDEQTVILVDEPENSLHPKWQTEYVRLLADLFYRYQPKIILATHSPLIVSGAELNTNHMHIFKGSQGNFSPQLSETKNVEEIYEALFDITTPENRYLSELLVKNMNLLAEGSISLEDFQRQIKELKENSFDPRQQEVLDGIMEMGIKIVNQ